MSRVFSKNVSNYLSLGVGGLGAILSGLGVFSISARVKLASTQDTSSANVNNVLVANINGSTVGLVLNLDSATTLGVPKARISARSVSTDARQALTGSTTIATGIATFIGGIINIASDTLTIYVNGVSDGSAGVTFANATWTLGTPTGADTVGGYLAPPNATADQFDGEIGEVAIWNTGLSGANFAALAAGTPASSVAAGNLVYYLPIAGVASPEPPTVGTPQGTITGSLPAGGIPLRPNADVSAGGWTSTGPNLYSVLDESAVDDADLITSAATPSNDVAEVALVDPATTAAGMSTIYVRARKT